MTRANLGLKSLQYVQLEVQRTMNYLRSELDVLEKIMYWDLSYEFLKQLQDRFKLLLEKQLKESLFIPDDGDMSYIDHFIQVRKLYLTRTSEEIKKLSERYTPSMGSFWEDVSNRLKKLSEYVKEHDFTET